MTKPSYLLESRLQTIIHPHSHEQHETQSLKKMKWIFVLIASLMVIGLAIFLAR